MAEFILEKRISRESGKTALQADYNKWKRKQKKYENRREHFDDVEKQTIAHSEKDSFGLVICTNVFDYCCMFD